MNGAPVAAVARGGRQSSRFHRCFQCVPQLKIANAADEPGLTRYSRDFVSGLGHIVAATALTALQLIDAIQAH